MVGVTIWGALASVLVPYIAALLNFIRMNKNVTENVYSSLRCKFVLLPKRLVSKLPKCIRSEFTLMSKLDKTNFVRTELEQLPKLCIHYHQNLPSASNRSEPAVKSVNMSLREMEPLTATTMLSRSWSAITQNGSWTKQNASQTSAHQK